MAEKRDALEIGADMAKLLIAWRPEMNPKDVVDVIMHALERYSNEIEGPGELGFLHCLRELEREIAKEIRSI